MVLGGGARLGMWMQIGAANGGNGEAKTLRREAVDGSQAAAAVVAMARAESRREPVRCRCAGARRPEVRTRNWDRADRLSRWAVNEPNSSEPGLNFELGSSKLQPPAAVYFMVHICIKKMKSFSRTSVALPPWIWYHPSSPNYRQSNKYNDEGCAREASSFG